MTRGTHRGWLCVCFAANLLAILKPSLAQTVIDRFDGTAIDTSRWEVSQQGGASVWQDDAINFSIPVGGYSVITTRVLRIAVGGSARVDLIPHAPPEGRSSGKAYFQLATNSAGPNTHMMVSDTYNFGFEIGFDPASIDFAAGVHYEPPLSSGQIGRGQNFYHIDGAILDRQFSLLLDRLTLTNARFSVFDSQGSLLQSFEYNVRDDTGRPTPSELFVALGGFGSLTYDNLVLNLPEPSMVMLVMVGAMIVAGQRRTKSASPNRHVHHE